MLIYAGGLTYSMEKFIKAKTTLHPRGGADMAKVLIASLFNADAVLLAATRLSAERLILFINKVPCKEQDSALKLIEGSLGKIMQISKVKVNVYDIVATAEEAVKVIDQVPEGDTIYVNVTSGRKTLALALIYASYTRIHKVKKIAYNPEEDKKAVIYLPKLSFNLKESQKKILEYLGESDTKSHVELADKIDISRAMLYRSINELQDLDLVQITEDNKVVLTDAGKIARL